MPREYLFFLRALASLFLSVLALSAQSFTPIRVNSGGDQYVDSQGVVWSADNGFIGAASSESTATGITGTLSPGIYQSERFARVILYSFSVPNGTYTVNLRFAEIPPPGGTLWMATLPGGPMNRPFRQALTITSTGR